LAIVLIIVALLLSSLLSPLSAQIDQRNYNETQQQISEIREALIGFAVVNGRLPRPATSATNGAENPANCGSEALCTGFIPWSTLGVKKTDAWNKIIQYSVSPAYADLPICLEYSRQQESADSRWRRQRHVSHWCQCLQRRFSVRTGGHLFRRQE
jgi:type II secretory pathway pseudopilin PulG